MVVRVGNKFPEFNGAPASSIEVWSWTGSVWIAVPYQVDEVRDEPETVVQFLVEGTPGLLCGPGAEQPTNVDPKQPPCELLYELRGTDPPSGSLSPNDEIVFIAGDAGGCDAPTTSWPSGMHRIRYRLELSDDGQAGCVYVYRRTSGTAPAIPDLVRYDPAGDGEAGRPGLGDSCKPAPDACGAIIGEAYDVAFDGDSAADVPAYRLDFLGNWSANKLFVGETTGADPSENMLDLLKWRAGNETEMLWDLYEPTTTACAYFGGYIDGPVRVVRPIQGAASGALTRKYEFAYPGEIFYRILYRVHALNGPIYTYADLTKANVSPAGNPARVYKAGFTKDAEGNPDPYDDVDGQQPSEAPPQAEEWYQVSSPIGSFVRFLVRLKDPGSIGSKTGAYDDTATPLWPDDRALPDRDTESGDYAAFRTEWRNIADTQEQEACVDPFSEDDRTVVSEETVVFLSSGLAAPTAGETLVGQRKDAFSRCIEEEEQTVPLPPPGPPCVPTVSTDYARDRGPGVHQRERLSGGAGVESLPGHGRRDQHPPGEPGAGRDLRGCDAFAQRGADLRGFDAWGGLRRERVVGSRDGPA